MSRLVALVLLPTVAFAIVSIDGLLGRRATVANARTIAQETAVLERWTLVRGGIEGERLASTGLLRIETLGLSLAQLKTFTGIDIAEVASSSRRAVDLAIAQVPTQTVIDPTELAAVRAGIDARTISDADIASYYNGIYRQLNAEMGTRIDTLGKLIADIPDSGDLPDSLDALRASAESIEGIAQLLDDYTLHMADYPERSATARERISADLARFQVAQERVSVIKNDAVRRRYVQAQASDPMSEALKVMNDVAHRVATGDVVKPSLLEAAPAVTALAAARTLVAGQIVAALDSLSVTAEQISLDTRASYDRWLYLSGFTTAVTLAAAVIVGRRIVSPVRTLSTAAMAVVNGDLDISPLDRRGPAEVVVASAAFNDLVANLRVIEDQTLAIAASDFDSPLLTTVLPGRLGESMHESVETLLASIRERDELESELSHQATHDGLTGLLNRKAMIEYLDAALARAARHGSLLAVFFIDLDHFKRANDTHGHRVGDIVLTTIAERMRSIVRKGDAVARFGGDEFAVVSESLDGTDAAVRLGRRLVESLTEPVVVDNIRVSVGASVGVAFGLDATEGPLDLLAKADLAVYQAKQKGRGRVELFDVHLQAQMIEANAIDTSLREALESGDLELYYQPVLNTDGRALWGAEALIRWHRPGLGLQSPAIFIPIAETSPLIIAIDRWVLRHAFTDCATWNRELGRDDLHVSVNVSGRHLLSPEFPEDIAEALHASGVDPGLVNLEITETVLLTDLPSVAVQLAKVRDLGVRVSIDDFGTGYTSLAHLRHLPVDTIKIDRSFVASMEESRDRSLVQMVVDLGRALDVSVVAEGVETTLQFDTLEQIGCDKVQGFLFGAPMPNSAFVEVMRSGEFPIARHAG
ncbi:MAG: putative bifunctional diguanylate cyclase/phosphodiesterase [Acidimicrobiia bacterium]